jgi:hypothetical protein
VLTLIAFILFLAIVCYILAMVFPSRRFLDITVGLMLLAMILGGYGERLLH